MASPTRTRLTTDARRDQLLVVGAKIFAERPYNSVALTEVVAAAGVSRGLFYHYFPTKQDFAVAITQHACADMFDAAQFPPGTPPTTMLHGLLDRYFAFAADNRDGFRAMHRGLLADEVVRELRSKDIAGHEQRVIAAFGLEETATDLVRFAIRGWLSYTITVCLEWLDHGESDSAPARELCARMLLSSLEAVGVVPERSA